MLIAVAIRTPVSPQNCTKISDNTRLIIPCNKGVYLSLTKIPDFVLKVIWKTSSSVFTKLVFVNVIFPSFSKLKQNFSCGLYKN